MRSMRVLLAGGLLAAVMTGMVSAQVYDAGTELAIVEKVHKSRADYTRSLTELFNYYLNSGDAANARRAERELGNFRNIEQYDYTQKLTGELVQPGKAFRFIPEAEDYFVDAKIISESRHKARKDLALARYEAILSKWPESAKAPDAAYEMAEIFSGLYYRDYDRAADYYKRAYDLNPATPLPALTKAGDMYYRLQRYTDAATMYKLSVEGSRSVEARQDAERMLTRLAKMGF